MLSLLREVRYIERELQALLVTQSVWRHAIASSRRGHRSCIVLGGQLRSGDLSIQIIPKASPARPEGIATK